LTYKNEKKLLSLLWKAIRSKDITLGGYYQSDELCSDLLERNGILLADMMYNWTEFPKGFVPVCLGMEYYALLPEKIAMKALTLGHLDLK